MKIIGNYRIWEALSLKMIDRGLYQLVQVNIDKQFILQSVTAELINKLF